MRYQFIFVFIVVILLTNASCSSTKKVPSDATNPSTDLKLSLPEKLKDKKASDPKQDKPLQRQPINHRDSSAAPLKHANQLINDAIAYLQEGDENNAHDVLSQALYLNPKSAMAKKLIQQIDSDPMRALGPSYVEHRMQAGETISGLAEKFLKDPLLFHILAKYNNIQKPKHVRVGQLIKIPKVLSNEKHQQDPQISNIDPNVVDAENETDKALEPAPTNNEPVNSPPAKPIDVAEQERIEQQSQLEEQALLLMKKEQYQFVIQLLKPKIAANVMADTDKTLIRDLLIDAHLFHGENLANQQQYPKAIAQMSEILQLDADNEPAKIKKQTYHAILKADQYYQQGQKAFIARRFQEAQTAFSQVIQFQPNYLDSQQKLAKANKQLAVEYYHEAVKLRRRHHLDEAMSLLDKALVLDPENVLAKKSRNQVADMIDKLKEMKK